jgi:L-fuconolactonase
MFIVDSQVHIWAANMPERPWFSVPKTHRTEPLDAEHLLREMDAAGVARAILVPPGFDGPRNDLILAAAQRYPDRFAAMGRLDTKAPDASSRIAGWRTGVNCIRLTIKKGLLALQIHYCKRKNT